MARIVFQLGVRFSSPSGSDVGFVRAPGRLRTQIPDTDSQTLSHRLGMFDRTLDAFVSSAFNYRPSTTHLLAVDLPQNVAASESRGERAQASDFGPFTASASGSETV